MTKLITRYQQLLYEISAKFSALMDKQGEWTSDYSLWCTEWEAWAVDDMLYVLEHYKHLYQSRTSAGALMQLHQDVADWLDYNIDVAQFGIQYINLKSWLNGAPRMSQEQIDHLRELRDSFNNTVKEYQAEFGKLDTNPQPEHLRNLKSNKK